MSRGQVLGVVSAKGGVGKTTVVCNLGVALASHYDKRVLVVDGNLTAPNLGLYLDIVRPPVTLHDVLRNQISINQSIYVHRSGLHVVPGSLSYDYPFNSGDLKEEINKVADRYDYIILDSAPGLNDETSAVIEASDKLLVVTNPGFPSVTTTYKTIKMAEEKRVPIIGVVLNRAGNKYEMSADEVNDALGFPIVSVIPDDPNVLKAVSQGLCVVQSNPRAPATEKFLKLAGAISGGEYLDGLLSKARKLLEYWKKLFLGKNSKRAWKTNDIIPKETAMETELIEIEKTKTGPKQPVASLNAKKKVYESALTRIKKNYEGGLLHKGLYEELKARYEGELHSIKEELASTKTPTQ